MKITYLRLKNYAGILAGMKKKDVEFSFKEAKNKIILLIGENASGKTTILSTLHPFAYPGSMDIRSGSSLIVSGEQGLKEIHYEKDEKEIKIKHVYTPTSTGHSVKSYISVDGEEKNPNGNVTSFYSIVEMVLDIEPDYLKLTRLGANVSGLINMKSTDRKGLATSLLSDVDIYSGFYKKVNSEARDLKVLLKSVGDKLSRHNITDKSHYQDEINENKEKLIEMENKVEELKKQKYGLDHKFSELNGEDIEEEMYKITKLIVELGEDLDKLAKEITKYKDCRNIRSDIESELIEADSKLKASETLLESYINTLDEKMSKKKEYEMKVLQLSNNKNIESLLKTKESIKEKIKLIDSLPKIDNMLGKNELFLVLGLLNSIEKYLDNLLAFDDNLVVEAYRIMNETSINRFVDNKVHSIDKIVDNLSEQIISMSHTSRKTKKDDGISVLYTLYDNCGKCPYYLMNTNEPTETACSKHLKDLKAEKSALLMQREYLLTLPIVSNHIKMIVDVVETINKEYPVFSDIVSDIPSLLSSKLVNKNFINNMIEYSELLEDKQALEMDLYRIDAELNELYAQESIKDIQIALDLIISDIEDIESKIPREQEIISELTVKVDGLRKELEGYDIRENIRERSKEINRLRQEAVMKDSEYKSSINEVRTLREQISSLASEIDRLVDSIKITTDTIYQLQHKLQNYEELMEQSELLTEKYEELNIIRESLSSTKGIPLLFMQLYLKNTRILANHLLENVFDGDLEISEFVINEKEFKIPYTRHGIEVSDVAFASQGESSFLSLALSFALMQQSLKSYNVMLLDEIDAALDMKNRNIFISILEQQLEEIDCEQVFMITHNNVFDNYPVDILLTSAVEIDNYRNIGTLI